MCGIIGYVGKKQNALQVILDGLKTLEYRGYDSSGIAFMYNDTLTILKEEGKLSQLEKNIDYSIPSRIGIGHTRWATHGKPEKKNAHPHKIGKITIVHNGIIENYDELKLVLEEYGYTFISDTDTEIACALIDKLYQEKNDMVKVLMQCKNLLRGSYALGILIDDEPDTLYAIRKDSPLIIGVSNDETYIASDVPAILKYTRNYILLDDNEIAKIDNNINIYDIKGNLTNKEIETFEANLEVAMKNGYEHFMLKEIYEQPKIINDTINTYIYDGLEKLSHELKDFSKYNKIDIIACGSAYHTGLIGKSLIESYGDIPVNVYIASEYRYQHKFFDTNTLVLVISQSGETADTLAALRLAKEKGIDTLAIVNTVGSSIAREANKVLYMKAGVEIAVATTKAYSAGVALLSLIAIYIGIVRKSLNKNEINMFWSQIYTLEKMMLETLENTNEWRKIAKSIYNKEHIFFIGRGIDYALVLEGSLKLKEISYIHSEAYPAGELKHGTISLIEKDTPVIALATDEALAQKTISNIKEVKTRGANVIYITTEELNKDGDFYNEKIIIPSIMPLLQPLLVILPLQIIAYEVAKLRDCDIDQPRNLAKSVTVE